MASTNYRLRAALGNLELPDAIDEIVFQEFCIKQCPNRANPIPIYNEDGDIDDVDWQYPSNPDRRYPVCDYFLERIFVAEEENGWAKAESILSWTLTMLRLYKQGNLWGSLYKVDDIAKPGITVGFKDITESMRRRHTEPPSQGLTFRRNNYTIDEPEIDQLRQFIDNFNDAPIDSFGVAIRRFNQAFDRDLAEDKAVDLFIALESLLSEDSDAIRYKIALRGSHIIGENRDEVISLNAFLKKAYNYRSGIVHGTRKHIDWLKERSDRSNANLDDLEDIVRRLIRYMLEKAVQGQIINPENIDEIVFFK